MGTRLEKLEESLKREQEKQDTKRLKKAWGYFELAEKTLRHQPFHTDDAKELSRAILDAVDNPLDDLGGYLDQLDKQKGQQ